MNIEAITIGNIITFILALGSIIGACGVIFNFASKTFSKAIKTALKPTNDMLDDLRAQVSDVDMAQCKNFLVRFLSDVEQGNKIDEVEKERFYETYEHYTKCGGNSYIHDKVEKLRKSGKL